MPFSYFLGCQVKTIENIPDDMESLVIPDGKYQVFTARGKMPDCVAKAWKDIWISGIERAYKFDFEVYSEKSRDWNNAKWKSCFQ